MDIKKKEVVKDRHSRTGIVGSPKKGGAGGKGTWGVGGWDDLKEAPEDPRDPNYISDEEVSDGVVLQRTEVTSPIEALLREYFSSGDADEAVKATESLGASQYASFIKKALSLAMENHAFERELVSRLLTPLLSSKAFPSEKIADGFQLALDALPDTVLDTPDAVDLLSKFIARALVDEVIPPAFVNSAKINSELATECLALVNGLVTEKHRFDRLAHIWGPGDLSSVKRLKEESELLLKEYLTTGDLAEADKCVRKLNAPDFHPQLVKLALRLAMQQTDNPSKQRLLSLLGSFAKEDLVSQDHIERGFKIVSDSIADIKLDVPDADKQLAEFSAVGRSQGWLSAAKV